MTEFIRAAALARQDQTAVVPSAEKRAQASSALELIEELNTLIRQIGTSRQGSIALTKIEEAGHFVMSHILNTPEPGQGS